MHSGRYCVLQIQLEVPQKMIIKSICLLELASKHLWEGQSNLILATSAAALSSQVIESLYHAKYYSVYILCMSLPLSSRVYS